MILDGGCFTLNNCDYSRQQFGRTSATLVTQASASSYFDLSCTQKKCNFAAWILYLKVWNEILTLNESHILWLQTHSLLLSSAPHTHTHTHRFLWVIFATDSGPVIVSCAAGSEASLSYWPASDSHWAKTQGWWHCCWEHVNFAL